MLFAFMQSQMFCETPLNVLALLLDLPVGCRFFYESTAGGCDKMSQAARCRRSDVIGKNE